MFPFLHFHRGTHTLQALLFSGLLHFFAEHDLILLNNFDKNICIELIYDSLLYIVNLFTCALLICVLLTNEIKLN